jgi:8-oxo-dGTP pyrophosphatase MutT (NUDIX family)
VASDEASDEASNEASDAASDRSSEVPSDVASRIARIADELRAFAATGLHFTKDPYDRERYERIREHAAELLSIVDTRPLAELRQLFHADVGVRTPIVCVEGAVFDDAGRVLVVQRADSGEWCLPGGVAEVGETPSFGAEREVWEETGLRVQARRVLAVYDNLFWGLPSIATHAHYLIFECEYRSGTLTPSIETTAFRWVGPEDLDSVTLYRTHRFKVPEVLRLHRAPEAPTVFH